MTEEQSRVLVNLGWKVSTRVNVDGLCTILVEGAGWSTSFVAPGEREGVNEAVARARRALSAEVVG